ncbi:MAG: EAL domain-containing protein [Pseudomonadales bacterium]|nr:EAL domain-containing protein [Pseudomonadales bacterium]
MEPDNPNDDSFVQFLTEGESRPVDNPKTAIKVLAVDDDADFQQSTAFALSRLHVLDHPIELLQANSYSQASQILAEHTDIAIALVDVVMETEDAGLRLVRAIRDVLGNNEIRIILVTGQPGIAPMQEVMQQTDIDDYWTKSDLSIQRLQTILTTNFRSFGRIREINRAKRGLQLIAESSGILYSSRDLNELSNKMLEEIAKLLGMPTEGMICIKSANEERSAGEAPRVITGSGEFVSCFGQAITTLDNIEIRKRLEHTLRNRESSYEQDFTCLFFPDDLAGSDYVMYINTARPLTATEIELLRVFSINICGGLHNVALVSKLDCLAYEDDLLHIPNRNALLRTLDNLLRRPQRNEYALALIDIDNFSNINSVLGNRQGDQVLGFVAHYLQYTFDKTVLVARVKDDLFAVLGPANQVDADRIRVLSPILTESAVNLVKPAPDNIKYCIETLQQITSINISSVHFPLELADSSAVNVLTKAGITLKSAKKKGIGQHVHFDPKTSTQTDTHFQMLLALQRGLKAREIAVVLQPQFCIRTGEVIGFEALARWCDSSGKMISPAEFIPVAESSGLILHLGQQVLEISCQYARQLKEKGYGNLRIGVNLSAIQFELTDMAEKVKATIAAAGISPQQIEVEVTESVAMQSYDLVIHHLQTLRKAAINIAIDDFGTGFSSLGILSELPADRLKIDKSFIDNLQADDGSPAIAQTVIHLGERFGMKVIAEGVETVTQLRWLQKHGCDEVQGYLYARPMAIAETFNWLQSYKPTLF